MTGRDFLRGKLLSIFLTLVSAAVGAVFLGLMHVNGVAAFFISGVYILCSIITLLYEFLHKREFYNNLLRSLDGLDKKHLLCEMAAEPSFWEGRTLCRVLRACNKSMNDELALHRAAVREYRDYVETWVHEVKTPIASAMLAAENNRSDVTRGIGDELQKIDDCVEQALFYSRAANVEKDYIITAVSLEELVRSALKKNARLLIESGAGIEQENLALTVYTDAKWTDFIIGQLLANAVKYRKGPLRLRLWGERHENSVSLFIADNGPGILAQDLPRVFEKAFTGQNGRSGKCSSGMGLYLCKNLCDKLNLGIHLTTQGGAVAELTFPKSNMYF